MNPRKKSFVIQALRRASYRWPSRYQALKRAHIGRNEYVCQACGEIVNRKRIQLDHVEPVVPVTGWTNWDDYIERMFPDNVEGYSAICKDCHSIKTKSENAIRKEITKAVRKKVNK